MRKTVIFLVFIAFWLPASDRFIALYIGSEKITVEVADDHASRKRGLMFRKSIPEDYGMLFVFEEEQIQSMWMKNTLIHLDIIFLNRDRQVVDIYANVPPCRSDPCDSYVSRGPARYALELKSGRSQALNLKTGDTLFFILNR